MNPLWIGVIGTIGGALIGGGIALLNTRQQLKHQASNEKRKHHLDKLDELSEKIDGLRIAITHIGSKVFDGKIRHGSTSAIFETFPNYSRIEILTSIYAPQLITCCTDIQVSCQRYIDALPDDEPENDKGLLVSAELLELVDRREKELIYACIQMQQELVKIVRGYL